MDDDEFGDLSDLDVEEFELLTQVANVPPSGQDGGSDRMPERTPVTSSNPTIQSQQIRNLSSSTTISTPGRRPGQTLVQTTLQGAVVPGSAETFQTGPVSDEPATHHELVRSELPRWIYPTNLGTIRDYQFNIVQKGLFHNLLVALPTGMGKTFIAATIMLNWFRWTKSAQIVFVAPTKPLVTQQVDACFGIVGIPRSETALMTGTISPGVRAQEWQSKRVFFMTPQTLINDLKNGICDPKRIVLIVVDEAHKATGAYAYVEVVKYVSRFNSSFRVLALTATPGSDIESVQAVIDGLLISRIEIRTEDSIDIQRFIHSREVEKVVFDPSEEMTMIQELYNKALQPMADTLVKQGAYWNSDPSSLTAYGLTQARQRWMASGGAHANQGVKAMVNAIITTLASLAHGMELLKFYGVVPFFTKMDNFRKETLEAGSKAGKYRRQIVENKDFDLMMTRLMRWTNDPDFMGHPKLEYLKSRLMNHFLDAGESDTKVIVFAHFRDSADDIIRVLGQMKPTIRAHVFVGQQSSKNSDGMDQKTQLAVMQKFKKNEINTLIATSIGEEGLDIGEVDLIVCYDSKASPLRMLQRMGRTGRKRTGRIILLQMKGKEENDAEKAKAGYQHMQEHIARGDRFDFHQATNRRIMPKSVDPVVDKCVVDIPEENDLAVPLDADLKKRRAKRPAKKFNMPDGVETGFVRAGDLVEAGGVKSGRKQGGIKAFMRKPAVEIVDRPSISEVSLSTVEKADLWVRFQQDTAFSTSNYDQTSNTITIDRPRVDQHPEFQLEPMPSICFPHQDRKRMSGGLASLLARMRRYSDKMAIETEPDLVDRWTGDGDSGWSGLDQYGGVVVGSLPRPAKTIPSRSRSTVLESTKPTTRTIAISRTKSAPEPSSKRDTARENQQMSLIQSQATDGSSDEDEEQDPDLGSSFGGRSFGTVGVADDCRSEDDLDKKSYDPDLDRDLSDFIVDSSPMAKPSGDKDNQANRRKSKYKRLFTRADRPASSSDSSLSETRSDSSDNEASSDDDLTFLPPLVTNVDSDDDSHRSGRNTRSTTVPVDLTTDVDFGLLDSDLDPDFELDDLDDNDEVVSTKRTRSAPTTTDTSSHVTYTSSKSTKRRNRNSGPIGVPDSSQSDLPGLEDILTRSPPSQKPKTSKNTSRVVRTRSNTTGKERRGREETDKTSIRNRKKRKTASITDTFDD